MVGLEIWEIVDADLVYGEVLIWFRSYLSARKPRDCFDEPELPDFEPAIGD